jgi:ankyrin repeat protein
MDLNQAIANLLHQENAEQSQDSSLAGVLERIFQHISKRQSKKTTQPDQLFSQLAELARSQHQEVFQALVQAEQQRPANNEPTLLMAAVMADQLDVVNALIAAGADVNTKITQFFEFNALSWAVDDEKVAIVQALLEAGADPNAMNANPGLAMLVKAVKKNNTDLAQLLIKYGASVKFDTGFKILEESAQHNNPVLIKLLLDAGCHTDPSGYKSAALRQAAMYCNVEVIQTLLAADAEVSPSGAEFLAIFGASFFAKQMGRLLGKQLNSELRMAGAVQVFIDAGVDVNLQGVDGTTPLILAISQGYPEIVQMLLFAGANPNLMGRFTGLMLADNYDLTFLHQYSQISSPLVFAAAFGRLEIVQMLMEYAADIYQKDEKDRSPITVAIREGHYQIVKLLENAGATVTPSEKYSAEALIGAVKQRHEEILADALMVGIDPNSSELFGGRDRRHKTALMFAAEDGGVKAAQMLLEYGADVNLSDRPGKKFGKTPLMYAAGDNHKKMLKLLLDAGAIVDAQDKRGQTALFYAVEAEAEAAVEVLLKAGADPHKQSWDGTPFEHGTYATTKIAKLLTAADKKKASPKSNAAREEMLRSAAFDGNTELVRDLIQQGVDVNAVDRDAGWSPLFYSAAQGYELITQLLIAAGADVNFTAKNGQTALFQATSWGHLEIVNCLINAGANVNHIEKDGFTALMGAVGRGNAAVLEALLSAGADPAIRAKDGQTALAMAIELDSTDNPFFDYKDVIEVLRKTGVAE